MRTTTTFSILFWTYNSRIKNNLAPVFARITVNKKQLNMSLKRRVLIAHWCPKKQRISGNSPESRLLNQYLDEVYAQLFQCFQELRTSNLPITPQAVKDKFYGNEVSSVHTLRDLIEYHNSTLFSKLNGNTSRLYLTSQKYLLEFLKRKYKCSDIALQELDYRFILNFESFLRAYKPWHYQKQIGNNAVMKHIQRLRKMVTLAYHIEWIDADPFRKFKQKMLPTQRGFLTASELARLESLPLDSTRLETVRDVFVFSCYTGISYTDLMALNTQSIREGLDGDLWIILQRQKTGNSVQVPLLHKAKNLINQYASDPRAQLHNRLFPKISNQKMNAYLKELAELAKIEKNVTFHMARHTFATTITLSNGVPIETISKMLGHHKLATTQIYARVVERKVSEDMKALRRILE